MTLRHCLKKSVVYLFQTCLDVTSQLYGDVLQAEKGFPSGSAGKESAHNAGDLGLEDPWRREWLPTPVFWPAEFHGLYIVHGVAESDTLSVFHRQKKGQNAER